MSQPTKKKDKTWAGQVEAAQKTIKSGFRYGQRPKDLGDRIALRNARNEDDALRLMEGRRVLKSLNDPTDVQDHMDKQERMKAKPYEELRAERSKLPEPIQKTMPLPPVKRRRLKR